MALNPKAIKGSGLVQLRNAISTQDGTTITEVETWTGPYAALKTKQAAVYLGAKSTSLTPTQANHGQLTLTRETQLPPDASTQPTETFTEVVWQELRKPVETHPMFAALTTDQIKDAKDKAQSSGPETAPDNELAAKLYDFLVKGTTEWSTGVPLVRRTTNRAAGNIGGGSAWFRDDPPVSVAGDWEFLKTADERRRDGKSFTRIEEWTGAEEWDVDLYPVIEP